MINLERKLFRKFCTFWYFLKCNYYWTCPEIHSNLHWSCEGCLEKETMQNYLPQNLMCQIMGTLKSYLEIKILMFMNTLQYERICYQSEIARWVACTFIVLLSVYVIEERFIYRYSEWFIMRSKIKRGNSMTPFLAFSTEDTWLRC